MEWVKRNTLGLFVYIERMQSEEFMKKVYVSEIVDPDRRGRSLGRWKDGVKEYMCEGGATRGGESWIKQGESVWIGRGGGSSAMAIPLEDIPREDEASELWIEVGVHLSVCVPL